MIKGSEGILSQKPGVAVILKCVGDICVFLGVNQSDFVMMNGQICKKLYNKMIPFKAIEAEKKLEEFKRYTTPLDKEYIMKKMNHCRLDIRNMYKKYTINRNRQFKKILIQFLIPTSQKIEVNEFNENEMP